MPADKSLPHCTPCVYRITVEGKLDPSWSDWLGGIQLTEQKEADEMPLTTLSGVLVDQAALRGLCNRLWDLNLVVRSVEQVGPATTSNKEQGGQL